MLTVCSLVQDNCAKQGLQPLEAFIGKIIQLYEMIVVRHGLMLVGQSYGMKTASHKVLAAALSDLHEKVHPPSNLSQESACLALCSTSQCVKTDSSHLKHPHNVETCFYCRQTFLSLEFQCKDDVFV